MKSTFYFGITLFAAVLAAGFQPCFSQQANDVSYNNTGFYTGASLLGAGLNIDENSETDFGFGLGIKAGYNFNTHIGLFVSVDGSDIFPDDSDRYALTHFDVGVKGILRTNTDRVRPFGRASFMAMAAVNEGLEITGEGPGLGAGVDVYTSENVSFEFSYNHSWLKVKESTVGPVSESNANTGRLMVGAVYHF
ncbi:MAG: outer membrane beta-barrel protein [Balneolaceae bacterium]